MRNKLLLSSGALALFAAVSLTLWSCSQSSVPASNSTTPLSMGVSGPTNWSSQPKFVQNAIAVQMRHENDLLAIDGVIGDGVGLDKTNPIAAVILVFTSRENVTGIPSQLEGIKTETTFTGIVTAHDVFTGTYRSPLPCGVTVGDNDECAAGSIGAIVTSTKNSSGNSTYGGQITVYSKQYNWGTNTPKFMLSCNHVFANENSATSPDQQDQPGRYDVSCNTAGAVGKLHSWNYISPSSGHNTPSNYYDAALAECNPGLSPTPPSWSPAMMSNPSTSPYTLSYTPTNTVVAPSLNMGIKKTGRTSGFNTATIAGINVTITVQYTHFKAKFIDQIYVSNGTYIQAGDSGSMSVVNDVTGTDNNDPVGLDFAGSSSSSFMNRMDHIANDFGLSFVQSSF